MIWPLATFQKLAFAISAMCAISIASSVPGSAAALVSMDRTSSSDTGAPAIIAVSGTCVLTIPAPASLAKDSNAFFDDSVCDFSSSCPDLQWLASIIDPKAPSLAQATGPVDVINCKDFADLVYGPQRNRNLLKPVADALAGDARLYDLEGMKKHTNPYIEVPTLVVDKLQEILEQSLRNNHTCVAEDGWSPADGNMGCRIKLQGKMLLWRTIYFCVKLLYQTGITNGIKQTNQRIYNAWRENDQFLRSDPSYVNNVWAFAPKYKGWWENYTEFLTTKALHGGVEVLVRSLDHDLLVAESLSNSGRANSTEIAGYNDIVKTFKVKADPHNFNYQWAVDWNWSTDTLRS